LRDRRDGGDRARDDQFRRKRRTQRSRTLVRGTEGQVFAVEPEAIEEEGPERQCRVRRFDVELAAEPAHRHLERLRAAVRPERERLAVENGIVQRKRSYRLDNVRNRAGHVIEAPREDAHLVGRFVHLHAGSVQLELENGLAEFLQRLVGTLYGAGQHRPDRAEQLDREAGERRGTSGQRCLRHRGEVARDHHRPPDVV
jgi:hypothetical protein